MALIIDSVTIPTAAGSLIYNGTSITEVIFNGTSVWKVSSGLMWSGNSFITSGSATVGVETSGNLCRSYPSGAWITVSSTGIFTGGPSTNTYGNRLTTNNNNTMILSTQAYVPARTVTIYYNVGTKSWTGSGASTFILNQNERPGFIVQTSGGLISFGSGTVFGPYISLT